MSVKIKWEDPVEDDVGSVEISRAAEILGSYFVVDTISSTSDSQAKSTSNTWTLNYVDTGGTIGDWYILRFYDGTSWSGSSNPLSTVQELRLCSIDDVKRITKLTTEFTDEEIGNFIDDSESDIFAEFGQPIMKTWMQTTRPVYSYDFTGTREKVYRIDRVELFNVSQRDTLGPGSALDTGSWTQHLDDGYLTIGSTYMEAHFGDRLEVEWVPWNAHLLACYLTAEDLLSNDVVIGGGDAPSANLLRVGSRISMLRERMRPKGMLRSSPFKNWDFRKGDFIDQDTSNIY